MSRHRNEVYLLHMMDYARKAVSLAANRQRADLDRDMALRYALIHLVCITGEAAMRVSPEARRQYAGIPWNLAKGMRNRLIHDYDLVDLDILWDTVTSDLPELIRALEAVAGPETGPSLPPSASA